MYLAGAVWENDTLMWMSLFKHELFKTGNSYHAGRIYRLINFDYKRVATINPEKSHGYDNTSTRWNKQVLADV